MSKRIKSKRDLPKQFDLKKYEMLGSLSDKDLFRQIYWRMEWKEKNWSEDLATYFLEHGCNLPLFDHDPFGEIKSEHGDAYYEQFKGGREFVEQYQSHAKSKKRLSTGYGIGVLSRLEVMHFSQGDDQRGDRVGKPFCIPDEEVNELLKDDISNHGKLVSYASDPVSLIMGDVALYISVDLSVPDEILISDMKNLLPKWREELEVSAEEIQINNSWAIIRKKIIEYNVLPYIDLHLWANVKGVSIPGGVLAVSLFPDGDKEQFAIAQTIRPFIDRLMNYESLEKIKREISKE
ncbi:DUF6387 family protein [Klebsiella quasipneumoniae subsp. similipneumoniae]|nr:MULTISPECIES: DUF6387 family protein [Klebsiella]HDT6555844.1 hypothetical protein [Raoultella ornithinolytica]KLE40926.1 hypothetical protein YA13_21875 [Klebsiella aerogenes]KLF04168.1 hypothetical protein YA25_13775 [Klebsiella aerogenes]MCS4327476.1 DUF6387 family protein [Klebsiella pneumoniae]MEB7491499.1 DUF6387 family protein [Klebsiella pneumoniae]